MAEAEMEGVIGRRLVLCPRLQMFSTDDLIRTCEKCGCFCLYCCGCLQNFQNDGRHESGTICHHFRVIFTDGACRQNGQFGATAGIGIAIGTEIECQASIPINSELDPNRKRTSQRAELLAAMSVSGLWL